GRRDGRGHRRRPLAAGAPAHVRQVLARGRRAPQGWRRRLARPLRPARGEQVSALLALRDVSVDYGPVSAVRDVTLEVSEGEIFGLVGESGCGKTTLALAVMGLLPRLAQVQGRIDFQGEDVLALPEAARRRLRGDRISMVFQDPEAAL